jgi:hypothetical protein
VAADATIRISLQIRKGNLNYQSQPTGYTVSIATAKGPTPGALAVPTAGINVDLSELSHPGFCWIQNLDSTNYVRWGIHDGATFHPVGKLLPGEFVLVRLDETLGEEESDTGTGTTGPVNFLYLKAHTAPCNVRVEVFES